MGVGRPRVGRRRSRASGRASTAPRPPRSRTRHRHGPRRLARARSGSAHRAGRTRRCSRCRPGRRRSIGPSMSARVSRRASGRMRPWSSEATTPDALALAPETEHLERRVDRDVRSLVRHDGDVGRALQPVPLDVPAGLREDTVARRGEGGEVGHRRPGHEPDARAIGQAQEIDEPARRDLLGDRRGRRERVQAGVLVPGAGQPVGGERGGQAARRRRTRSSAARPTPRAPARPPPPAPRRRWPGPTGPSGSGPPMASRRAARSTGAGDRPLGERGEVVGGEIRRAMEQAGANGSVDHGAAPAFCVWPPA